MHSVPIDHALINRAASVHHLLAPVKAVLDEPGVTEICVNRPGELFYETENRWERRDVPSLDLHWLRSLGVAIAAYSNNDLSDSRPILSAVLPDGERIQYVIPPACEEGIISLTIRKPSKETRSLAAYEDAGFFNHVRWAKRMAPNIDELDEEELELLGLAKDNDPINFMRKCIAYEKVIVVAGATGSGKTTFMKALTTEFPVETRIVTIEDVRELFLPNHPNHVHLLYPSEAKATEGALVTASSLLKSCMRMKPDRILLAELRGGETLDFIDACMTGHGGSITSVHANSETMAFPRMAKMGLKSEFAAGQSRESLMADLRMVVDVVVHVTNDKHSKKGRHATGIYFDPMRKRYPDGVHD